MLHQANAKAACSPFLEISNGFYRVLANFGKYPDTISNYTQAIHLNPNNIIAYYNRGNARHQLGDYQGAVADYTQALKLNANYSDIYNNRGLTRLHLGDTQGAIADYTQAVSSLNFMVGQDRQETQPCSCP